MTPSHALGLPHLSPRSQVPNKRRLFSSKERLFLLLIGFMLVVGTAVQFISFESSFAAVSGKQPNQSTQQAKKLLEKSHNVVVDEQKADAKNTLPKQNAPSHQADDAYGFRESEEIVVLLTSYKDSFSCAKAVDSILLNAYNPDRILIRVFEEADMPSESTCFAHVCELYGTDSCEELVKSGQLFVKKREAYASKGWTVLKNLVESMVYSNTKLRAAKFYMSIDSGAQFTPEWDLQLVQQWYLTGNDRAILSAAPKAIEMQPFASSSIVHYHCSARIHARRSDPVIEFNPPEPLRMSHTSHLSPVLQAQYSELFHFGPMQALIDVPSDPHTPFVGVGHEYTRAARFWTNGYDFYSPTVDVIFQRYDRPVPPSFNDDVQATRTHQWKLLAEQGYRRMRNLMGLPVSIKEKMDEMRTYGVGKKRSVDQWFTFSKIDPRKTYNESTTNQFVTCGERLHYVSYRD